MFRMSFFLKNLKKFPCDSSKIKYDIRIILLILFTIFQKFRLLHIILLSGDHLKIFTESQNARFSIKCLFFNIKIFMFLYRYVFDIRLSKHYHESNFFLICYNNFVIISIISAFTKWTITLCVFYKQILLSFYLTKIIKK